MSNSIKYIGTFASALFMSAILLTATFTSNSNASTITIHRDNDGHNIRIHNQQNNGDRIYEIDGKKLYWKDLSPAQQKKITVIENEIEKVERRLKSKEGEIQLFVEQLELKARAVEKEARQLELASIKVEKDNLTLSDVEKMMAKLEQMTEEKEMMIMAHQDEMEILEEKIEAFDMSFSDEINGHIEELENLLVTIAAEID